MNTWIPVLIFLLLLSAVGLAFVVTRIENTQYENNKSLLEQSTTNTQATKTAVVVFSRSGNTGVLANHIARKTQSDVYEIEAKDYELGVPGWISALKDARSNVATISPSVIDLTNYETVYLGSPIWLYSPAPPIWQFVKDNDFSDKKVILFNTFNSKFEQQFIDDFGTLVMSKNAVSFDHQFVKRGRMGDQLSTAEMLGKFDAKYSFNSQTDQ